MGALVRRVLAVLGGCVAAVMVVVLSDLTVGSLYPLPSSEALSTPEAARAAIAAVPLSALVLLVIGWALAAGVGAFAAVRLGPDRRMPLGLVVAALLVLATVANLAMLPHPAWMWPASLVLIPLLGWAGARAAAVPAAHGHAVSSGA
jgi:hypothetical protein